MANTAKNLSTSQLGTTLTTIYTVPASTSTIVKHISLCNLTASQVTVDVVVNGRYLLKSYPIPANGAYREDLSAVIPAGATIQALASGATSIDAILSGVEVA